MSIYHKFWRISRFKYKIYDYIIPFYNEKNLIYLSPAYLAYWKTKNQAIPPTSLLVDKKACKEGNYLFANDANIGEATSSPTMKADDRKPSSKLFKLNSPLQVKMKKTVKKVERSSKIWPILVQKKSMKHI